MDDAENALVSLNIADLLSKPFKISSVLTLKVASEGKNKTIREYEVDKYEYRARKYKD